MSKMNLAHLAFAAIPLAACLSTPQGGETIAVAFSVVGDDGATQRLAEALRNQLRRSGRYRLTFAEERADATLEITNHVQWYPVRGVDFIEYHVVFGRVSGERLGESNGRCPAERMELCASRIVSDFTESLGLP